jgi:capsular polysaccharide biosynthesis protein
VALARLVGTENFPQEDVMEIQELWRVMCQRWRIVAIVTLVCTSLALGWSLVGPVAYEAQSNVIISTSGSLSTASEAQSGLQVSVERAPTYAQLLRGPEVAARASGKLQGEIPAQTIQDSINARISSRLPMVIVTAKSPHANDAVQIVSAAAQGLQQYVNEIERPGRDGSLTAVYLSADPPTVARVGNPVRNAVLAGLLGLVLGMMLAVYRDRTDPMVKTAGQIARIGLAYRGTIVAADNPARLREAFRRLAVGCVAASEVDTGRELVVGVDPDCDTPFIAQGLAHGLVACGRKVTLVDAVAKKPLDGSLGLSDVANGSRSWAECAIETGTDHLWKMGIGTKGDSLDALLINGKDLKRRTTISDPDRNIVIAGPSIAHSSTAVALTAIADCALIVVRPGRSLVSDVVEAKMTLDSMGTPAIGMVFILGAPSHEGDESGASAEIEQANNDKSASAGSSREPRDSPDALKRSQANSLSSPPAITSVRGRRVNSWQAD